MRDGRIAAFNSHGSVTFVDFRGLSIPSGVRITCVTIEDQGLIKESSEINFSHMV